MALSGSVNHIETDLGQLFRRQGIALPYLIFSVSTNTTVISEPCEHGLSSTIKLQRLLEFDYDRYYYTKKSSK